MLADPGPFVSLYLDVTPERRDDAVLRVEQALGAQEGVTDIARATARRVMNEIPADNGMVGSLIGSEGVAATAFFPDPPRMDIVSVDALPILAPLIEADQMLAHHLVAVIEDSALHLMTIPRHGEPSVQTLDGNSGDDAVAVTGIVGHVATETDTSLVVLVANRQRLDDIFPRLRSTLPFDVALTGIDSDLSDDLAAEMVRQVADRSARRIVETMRLWRYHRTQGAAVDGVVDTLEALRQGVASMLLIHDDPADQRQAWFGDDLHRVAIDFADARPIDPEERLQSARLVDVLLRTALGLEVPVLIVPALPDDRLHDGMGAILTVDGAQADGLRDLLER